MDKHNEQKSFWEMLEGIAENLECKRLEALPCYGSMEIRLK